MSGYLHNIYMGNIATVRTNVMPLGEYLLFDYEVIQGFLGCSKIAGLLSKIAEKYGSDYQALEDSVSVKPNSFMVGIEFSKQSLKYDSVHDIELALYVYGKTVNNIYIPNRKLYFDEDTFKKKILFVTKEVLNGN